MVLDNSGSMAWYNRIGNLHTSAKEFIDTIYDAAEPHSVSTSIVPYGAQVNAGETLLSYFNRTDSHENSHCLNFGTADFGTSTLSQSNWYEQTLHFDPWVSNYGSYGYEVGELLPHPVCPAETPTIATAREILPWSTSKSDLKTYIDTLAAGGNTSTDIGVKWGTALLDQSMQPVLTGMIGSNHVDGNIAGRPYDANTADVMKILVVMTDGVNTSQYRMDDFRSGDSFVWRHIENGEVHYSVWKHGPNSEPITEVQTTTQSQIVGYTPVTYCAYWAWWTNSCYYYSTRNDPIYQNVEVPINNWYIVYNTNPSGGSSHTYEKWAPAPAGGLDADGNLKAKRLTWDEVWAGIPPAVFSNEILGDLGTLTNQQRYVYSNAAVPIGGSTKDQRLDAICAAAKSKGIIVFTIGLEVPNSYDARLRNCASSSAHYYDVANINMADAFTSIAASINQLRLVQ